MTDPPTSTPTPITIGDIAQDATTEAACEVLGRPGYDGIDDTDIDTLHAFVINVLTRTNKNLMEAKRIGRTVIPTFELSEPDSDAADQSSRQDPRRNSPQTSSHPSFGRALPQVPDQRGKWASFIPQGAGSNVTSIVGKQRRSKGGG